MAGRAGPEASGPEVVGVDPRPERAVVGPAGSRRGPPRRPRPSLPARPWPAPDSGGVDPARAAGHPGNPAGEEGPAHPGRAARHVAPAGGRGPRRRARPGRDDRRGHRTDSPWTAAPEAGVRRVDAAWMDATAASIVATLQASPEHVAGVARPRRGAAPGEIHRPRRPRCRGRGRRRGAARRRGPRAPVGTAHRPGRRDP